MLPMLYMLHLCILKWKIKSLLSLSRSCGRLEFFSDVSRESAAIGGILFALLSQFSIAQAHSRLSRGCSSSAAFLDILHDGKLKIGAINRNHHLNMRARFETLMQLFSSLSLNHQPRNSRVKNLFFPRSVLNLNLLPATWDPLKVQEIWGRARLCLPSLAAVELRRLCRAVQQQQQRHPDSACERPLCAPCLTYSRAKR